MFKSRKYTITAGFVIFVSIILILFLLVQKSGTNSIQFNPAEDPIACYSDAAGKLSKSSNMQLIISTHEIIETEENVFRTSVQQNITYLNRDSDSLQLQATETVDMSHHTFQSSFVYAGNVLYYTINGGKFTGTYSPSSLSIQYPPPVILDASIYHTVEGLHVGNSTVVRFFAPTHPEDWVGIEAASFLDACGSAWIDSNGDLVKSTYNLCYIRENVTVYKSVTIQITGLNPDPIAIPDNANDYLQLNDPLLPRQLEIACGYLLQSQSIDANHTDTITCQLFGDTRLQDIDILIKNDPADPFLEMTTAIDITNSSREGGALTSKQVEQYNNGNYTLSTNDSSAVTTEGVSSQDVLRRCQEVLIGTILLPHHVQNAKATHTGGSYRIEFTANDEFAQKIISDACSTLYNEPQLLDELSDGHRVDKILCYLEFNKETGLPTKSGIHFLGTYYVSELPYQLIFESDQTYLIP